MYPCIIDLHGPSDSVCKQRFRHTIPWEIGKKVPPLLRRIRSRAHTLNRTIGTLASFSRDLNVLTIGKFSASTHHPMTPDLERQPNVERDTPCKAKLRGAIELRDKHKVAASISNNTIWNDIIAHNCLAGALESRKQHVDVESTILVSLEGMIYVPPTRSPGNCLFHSVN